MNNQGHNHPLISVILFTYNQERYVEEAIMGLLSQDYDNIEFIFSDDCSQDMTPFIIQRYINEKFLGRKVIFNRNERNLGIVGNLNKAISLASGDYYVLAAGDDVSIGNRVSLSVEKIVEFGVDSLAMNFQYIDAESKELNQKGYCGEEALMIYSLDDYICQRPIFPLGPSRIIHHRVYDIFGMMREDCPTEDTPLTFRSLLLSGVAMINQVGVLYRWHGQNISSYDNLMRRINPVKIYNQYKADLATAYSKHLITFATYIKIRRILLDYKVVKVYERRLYHTHNRYKKYLLWMFFMMNPFVLKTHKMNLR